MKLNVKKFQEGGAMAPQAQGAAPEQGGAPQGGEQQDPMMQVIEMAQQAIQAKDCQMALGVCDMLLQLVQQSQGGGQQEAPAPESQPTFQRNGGKLTRRR